MSLPPEKASELKQLIHQQLSKVRRRAGGAGPAGTADPRGEDCGAGGFHFTGVGGGGTEGLPVLGVGRGSSRRPVPSVSKTKIFCFLSAPRRS